MHPERSSPTEAGQVLHAEGLSIRAGAVPVDEYLRAGEILGVAGLEGHGQEAFLEALAGLRAPTTGRVVIASHDRTTNQVVTGFRQAVRSGVAYLARDRRLHGIFPALSILDNFAIASFGSDTRAGIINKSGQRARYDYWRARLHIVAPDPRLPITALSGGNQQKVLLARWLALAPRVLLLNDPTRGVDQRTREILYDVFRDLARRDGLALVVLSTEIEEVLRLCDRILVFRDGQVARRLSGSEMSNDAVIAAMFGRVA